MENNDTICRTCLRLRDGLCDGEKEQAACPWYKRMTNFDKYFRYATDEELAETFGHNNVCSFIQNEFPGWCDSRGTCTGCIEEWLKQEVEE